MEDLLRSRTTAAADVDAAAARRKLLVRETKAKEVLSRWISRLDRFPPPLLSLFLDPSDQSRRSHPHPRKLIPKLRG